MCTKGNCPWVCFQLRTLESNYRSCYTGGKKNRPWVAHVLQNHSLWRENNIVIIPPWMYQQHQKTRTIYKAESSNPQVLSVGVSLLYRAGGTHPHYWPVSLLPQLWPEAKPPQSAQRRDPDTIPSLPQQVTAQSQEGNVCHALKAGWHLSQVLWHALPFPKGDQGWFCFSKRIHFTPSRF